MNVAEAIAQIRQKLGFHQSLKEEIILASMDLSKGTYEGEDGKVVLPRFLFDPTWETTCSTSTNIVVLPTTFIDFDEDWPIILRDEPPVKLRRESWEDIVATGSPGRPHSYATDKIRLYLFPLPDKAYTLQIPHYKKSASFAAAATHPWLEYFPNLIIYETVNHLLDGTRDKAAEVRVAQRLRELRDGYWRKVEDGEMQFRPIRVGPDD